MAELLSWHKVGQKVTVIEVKTEWSLFRKGCCSPCELPTSGQVYTIAKIFPANGLIFLSLEEIAGGGFDSCWFRPVYPQIIDQLRNLTAPINEREREHA